MIFANWKQCYLLLNILLWSDYMSIWLSSCSLCILSCFIYVVTVRGYEFLNAELCQFRKAPDLIERLKVPFCFSQREIICTCTFLFISEKFDSFIHNVLKSRVVEQKYAINNQIIVKYYYFLLGPCSAPAVKWSFCLFVHPSILLFVCPSKSGCPEHIFSLPSPIWLILLPQSAFW